MSEVLDPQMIAMAKIGKQKTLEGRLRSDSTTIDRKVNNLSKSSNIFNENEGEKSK